MSRRRNVVRIMLGIGAIAAVVVIAWIGLLAFPQLMCSRHVQVSSVSLYFDEMPRGDAEELAGAVARRLERSGIYDADRPARAFVFRNRSSYALIARLAGVPGDAQGFNLSALGNSYINAPGVAALGGRSGGGPRYSIWEGDLSHTIAHEIAHQYLAKRLGRRRLPQWKREGLAEYIANIALIRADGHATLQSRLDVYDDDGAWSATRGWDRQGWDRIHYEAGLLVEFLLDVEGYNIEELVTDEVTPEETRSALRRWADAQDSPGASS